MRTNFRPVSRLARRLPPCLLACALMAVATVGTAEALPRNAVPVTITPEMIQPVQRPAQPPKDLSYRVRSEYQPRETLSGATIEQQHHPGGCAPNSGSLCFDYRTGSALYKPMRQFLPDIPGMTPHNLSIRRNRIVADYTFK